MYTIHGAAHTRRLWAVRQDLATHGRAQSHITTWANRLTHWLRKTLQAWHTTVLALCFWFRHSVARASVALKTQLAHPLLKLHSYAHSYLSVLLLHGQQFEIYGRQVQTIATLHHVAMAYQKYLNRASMVAHYTTTCTRTINGCAWLAKEWRRRTWLHSA